MTPTNRRAFLSDVGRGMLAAGLGSSLADDLGVSTAFAVQGTDSIPLGEYAALVELMRSTPAESLQPVLAKMIGLKASKRTPLRNGPLDCRLFAFPLVAGSVRER